MEDQHPPRGILFELRSEWHEGASHATECRLLPAVAAAKGLVGTSWMREGTGGAEVQQAGESGRDEIRVRILQSLVWTTKESGFFSQRQQAVFEGF